MNNFEEIVVRIAESKGIDFAALPKEKQNQVTSELFAHLEGIFRDMADYPDDRFGRRKGIYKSSFANPSGETNPNRPGNSIHTTSDTSCPDQGCMLVGASGCTDIEKCQENDSKTCDNGCSNNNTEDCRDTANCVDNECQNTGGAQDCIDDTNCSDTGCQNSAGGTSGATGCVDNQNCSDINGCSNSPPAGAQCQDNNSCTDIKCDNQALSGKCTDTTGCKDDMCCNRRCEDGGTNEAACLDDMCGNGRSCTDNSTGTIEANYCKDDGCVNSPVPEIPNCSDSNCLDESCLNYSGCSDQPDNNIRCVDATCKNTVGYVDYTTQCTDGNCPNSSAICNPWYIDGIQCETAITINNNDDYILQELAFTDAQIPGNCIDRSCIFQPQCIDYGPSNCSVEIYDQPCTHGGSDNKDLCKDSSCEDLSDCVNARHCHDKGGCEDKECKNNGDLSYCTDWDGCIDKQSCSNNNFCQDQTDCQDGTASGEKCINARCINVAQNCTDLNCENGKCVDFKERYTDSVEECHDYICDP